MGTPPVLVVIGGYGAAGREICLLLKELYEGPEAELRIAGRDPTKAEELCRELAVGYDGPLRFVPAGADVTEPESLRSLLSGADLIIAALRLPRSALEIIGDRLFDGIDYIDIIPGLTAARVLRPALERQIPLRSRVIVGAGADPGLPGWMARYAAAAVEEARGIDLYVRYRDSRLARSSIIDILDESLSPGLIFRGEWRRAGLPGARFFRFRGGFGRTLCLPFFLEELRGVPSEAGLECFGLYHGGINWRTDLLTLLWKLGAHRLVSRTAWAARFEQAARRHTAGAEGISMEAVVHGANRSMRIACFHTSLYRATALPAVLAALRLLSNPGRNPGLHYLGEWVDPDEFAADLERGGFTFHTWKKAASS